MIRAGRHAEEAGLGVDGPQPAVGADVHPGDVVAHGPDAVALDLEPLRRDHHRQVRLAAGAGEGGGHVLDPALGILHAQNQHVFGHPAFAAAQMAGDSQGEALLAQQHVAAVARSDAPDGVVLGEVQNQPPLDVQFCLAVQTLGELALGAKLFEHRPADVGHDPHIEHDVDAVG